MKRRARIVTNLRIMNRSREVAEEIVGKDYDLFAPSIVEGIMKRLPNKNRVGLRIMINLTRNQRIYEDALDLSITPVPATFIEMSDL